MNQVEKKVLEILQKNTNNEKLNEESFTSLTFNDLHVNSLNFIKIIVELEDAFNIEFDDEQINYDMLDNLSNLVDLIYSYIGSETEVAKE